MSSSEVITCSSCSRQFRWKPELAGRRVKCKCGNSFSIPSQVPEPVGAIATESGDTLPSGLDHLGDAGEYGITEPPAPVTPVARPPVLGSACPGCTNLIPADAVICTRCGYNKKTGKKMGTAVKGAGLEASDVAKTAGKVMLSMVVGGAVAIVGAIIWLTIIYFLNLQIGIVAWLLGLGIGASMKAVNRNGSTLTGLAAAGFSFLSLAIAKGVIVLGLASMNMPVSMAFRPMDVLWFLLAISSAYKLASK